VVVMVVMVAIVGVVAMVGVAMVVVVVVVKEELKSRCVHHKNCQRRRFIPAVFHSNFCPINFRR